MRTMPESAQDPRSLPSASKLGLLVQCPGSWAASRNLTPLPKDDDSTYGDECHEAFAGASITLKDDQQRVVAKANELRDRLYREILPEGAQMVFEKRYWLLHHEQPILSGQVDWVAWSDGVAVILDLKSLFGETPPPDENYQLMAQAACFYQEMKRSGVYMREIFAGILQPRVTMSPELVRYDDEDLDKAIRIIVDKLYFATEVEDAPRIPGNHCKLCPANGVCVEAQAMLAVGVRNIELSIDKLTPEQMANILPRLNLYDALAKAIRQRAKQLAVATPGAIPGYEIKEVDSPLVITNAQGCYSTVSDWVTKEEFRQLLEVPVGALRELFCDRYSRSKNVTLRDAAEVFEERIGPYAVRGPQQQRLTKTKETK